MERKQEPGRPSLHIARVHLQALMLITLVALLLLAATAPGSGGENGGWGILSLLF